MKKILKEPFLHFMLIGAAMFLLYGLAGEKNSSKDEIVITDFDVNNIISTWEMQWKRPPSEKELQNLIGSNIKQEVFYQVALEMNLDHNDEIIKRRLAQKMQFLSNDIAAMVEPTDEILKEYFQEHSTKYLTQPSYSFYQITFSPDKRKDNYNDAKDILEKYTNATFDKMKQFGDQLPFSFYYENAYSNDLGLQLGSEFPKELKKAAFNQWTGPISSGFGYHLVYITQIKKPTIPSFNSVKKSVLRDFEYDNQQKIDEAIYQELKSKFDIKFDINSEDFNLKFVENLQTEFNK